MKQYEATIEHPTWRHKGKAVDLRDLSDRDAAKLVKDGFPFLRKKEKIDKSKTTNKE